jgi:hypothetical protein
MGREYFSVVRNPQKKADWDAMLARPGHHLDMESKIDFGSIYPLW